MQYKISFTLPAFHKLYEVGCTENFPRFSGFMLGIFPAPHMINAGLHPIKKLGRKTALMQMIWSSVVQKSKQKTQLILLPRLLSCHHISFTHVNYYIFGFTLSAKQKRKYKHEDSA